MDMKTFRTRLAPLVGESFVASLRAGAGLRGLAGGGLSFFTLCVLPQQRKRFSRQSLAGYAGNSIFSLSSSAAKAEESE
jgi:hypothetical protein